MPESHRQCRETSLPPHSSENDLIRLVSAGVVPAFASCLLAVCGSAQAQTLPISLKTVVTPSTPKASDFAVVMVVPIAVTAPPATAVATVYGPPAGEPVQAFVSLVPVVRIVPGASALPVSPLAAMSDLSALVAANSVGDALDGEASCLATAVYFEARGESLDGQLAVAQVVMNRAVSGRYPTSWCAVVKQRAQFSFVRSGGRFPAIKAGCVQWAKAQAIARVATKRLASTLSDDVLWYHANYVAPSWGRRLNRVSRIGAHIFYRS